LDALNDRLVLDLALDSETCEEPEILAVAVITDEIELTEVLACARCGGECKVF